MEELNMAGRRMASAGEGASHVAHDLEDESIGTLETEEQQEMMIARHEVLEDQNRQLNLQLKTLKSLLQKQVRILYWLLNFFLLFHDNHSCVSRLIDEKNLNDSI